MKLAILCPLAAQVQAPAFDAIIETIVECERYVAMTPEPRGVDRRIGHRGQTAMSRSALGWEAAQNGAEYFLWLDDDMVPPSRILERLLAHDKPMVSAAYFSRSHAANTGEGQYPMCAFNMLDERTGKPFDPPPLEPRGLKEVQIVGFGCLLMKRRVWDDVWRMSGGSPFRTDANMTEDVYFLNFARKAGHSVWLDTSLVAGHLKTIMITDKNRERIGAESQDVRWGPQDA